MLNVPKGLQQPAHPEPHSSKVSSTSTLPPNQRLFVTPHSPFYHVYARQEKADPRL